MSQQFYDEGEAAAGGKKVLLATPSYGNPSAAYAFAVAQSRAALAAAGISSAYLLLQGNCHVDDARNSIARDFLESDCTDLVFLDADVDWQPKDLVALCQCEQDVIGGVYPYRRENSEEMPVRLRADCKPVDGVLEVDGLPTGFLKIRRHVLEKMAQCVPRYFDKLDSTALIFDRPDPDAEGTRWGGDIAFCRRWQSMGGRLYALTEVRLGHTAQVVVRDSLAAFLRRAAGDTLAYLVPKLRAGTETESDYNELAFSTGGNHAADAGVLAMLAMIGRRARGPILEMGSGVSSIVLAAVTDEKVYTFEHQQHFAAQTHEWAERAGINGNLGICHAPLTEELWYDVGAFDLPQKFAVGFLDGPQRIYGTRLRFFDQLADRCSAIVVDDIKTDFRYATAVREWALSHERLFQVLGRAALITRPSQWLPPSAS